MEASELPRWNDPTRSEQIELLVAALAAAQAEIKSPERNRIVNVTTRDQNKSYSFKYATLDHIIEVIRAPLTKNALWFTQIMKEDKGTYILDTRLMHGSGQWIACQTPIFYEGGGNQAFGSALTFMRRYSLTSLLGIAAEEDDDANTADGNTVNQVQDRKPIAPKPDVMKQQENTPEDQSYVSPHKIEVQMLQDESGSNWMVFGQELIHGVRHSKSLAEAEEWSKLNEAALEEMMKSAPKLYANLQTAILKDMRVLEKAEKVGK